MTHRLAEDEVKSLLQIAENSQSDPQADLLGLRLDAYTGWLSLHQETRSLVQELADGSSLRPELHLTNLPIMDALEATPIAEDSVRTISGTLSEFIMLVFSIGLGSPISYFDQRNGNIFHDVFPTRRNSLALSSQSSEANLGFHSEMFFHPSPPEFLALHCLRPDVDEEAITGIASLADIEVELNADELHQLRQPAYAVDIAHLHGSYTHQGRAIRESDPRPIIPVIYEAHEMKLFRFEPELMTPIDGPASGAIHHADEIAASVAATGRLTHGSLLLIDNRRAVHSRSPFKARFDGTDRWLRRMMIRAGHVPETGKSDEPESELSQAWAALGAAVSYFPYSRRMPR